MPGNASTERPPRGAAIFATCLAETLLPEVGRAVETLLERLGLNPHFPPRQVCCGQSLFKAGHPRQAARAGAAWVRAFRGAEVIVSPSGSCVAHVRKHLPGLLTGRPDLAAQARALAARTFELSEFLVRVLGRTDLGAHAPGAPWAYHPSCGLHRALGEDEAPYLLLNALAGEKPLPLAEAQRCCGFGGPFSVSHPEISGGMLAQKLKSARQARARVLVVGDVGCLLHLSCGAREQAPELQVLHLAQILAGVAGPEAGR